MCAYLRMNLSTKEIAPLMNISVRGVEISRYRLRKKFELHRDDNLIEFLLNI
ncbi:helix-turn-helix transcriptional regulator [Ancylomarina sp.]